jgi:tRNA (guanine37-N1)-methyltransferase
MLITILTIFPEMFPGSLEFSLSGKALGKLWDLKTINIRDYATNKHHTVDDSPYGGGAGMVMKPDVVHMALQSAISNYDVKPEILFMTPRGVVFSNKVVRNIMTPTIPRGIVILCGRYEGVDQRVIDYWKTNYGMMEISIGDYVLFGGELPAMVVIDSCLRLVPGIMNNAASTENESFSVDLLEHPQYTKPAVWNGDNVPSVLLSGNHREIALWQKEQAKRITQEVRPDLWMKYEVGRE